LPLYILIRIKVGCAGNYMPEAWAMLLSLATDDDQHGAWLDRMTKAAPAILDDFSDLKLWLTEDRDLGAMLDRLKSDVVQLEMTQIAFSLPKGVDASEGQRNVVKVLTAFVRERPPILFGTCDWLSNQLDSQAIETSSLIASLQQRRDAILAEREAIQEAMTIEYPPLTGWVFP
jgi:hypothetical protein